MANKRRREQVTVDTQLVEIYEDLANIDDEIRIKAAQALLLRITPEANPTAQDVTEIIRRLVRGLCSGRKAARLGFSIALTELLTQLYNPTSIILPDKLRLSDLIETLKEQTHTPGNVSGEELRDHQLGRLFGAEALVKSGVLFEPTLAIEPWSQILDIVLDLAKKKSSLREECGWILYGAVQDLGSKGNDTVYAQLIIDRLQESSLAKTPEGVAIWLKVHSEIPGVILPTGMWHNDDPLDAEEKTRIAKILKEASTSDLDQAGTNSKAPQKGHWTSKLHFVWDVVLSQLLTVEQTGYSRPMKRQNFRSFWLECVDNSLFASSSSDERKYWGFLLFQRMLHNAPEPLLPALFSQNLMRCLMNQLASPERYLNRIAKTATNAIIKRAQTQPSTVVAIIKGLLQPPQGRINFDQSTRTKTVEKVLTLVNESDLAQVLSIFRRLLLSPGAIDEKATAAARQILADHLVLVVRSKQTGANEDDLGMLEYLAGSSSILAMFAEFAYATSEGGAGPPQHKPNPPISSASRDMFRSRISSCLTHLINKSADPSHFTYTLVKDIRRLEENDHHHKSVLDAEQNVEHSIRRAWKILEKINSKEKEAQPDKKQVLRAFKLLYSLTIIQVYNGDADAVNVLDELKDCYDSLVKHRSKGKQGASEVLVEILLSFVAKSSMMFRRLAQQVLSACASDVNRLGLQAMIKVLETKESVSGQDEMFDREADDDEDVEESSDVEEIQLADARIMQHAEDEAGSDLADAEGSSKDASGEENDDDDVSDDELAVFNAKLAQALRTKPLAEDHVSNDSGDSADEDMNDEQMAAVDAQLVEIFKERKRITSKKSQNKDAKETIINFKCRVLELLEILIKQRHASAFALDILLPLLRVIRTTTSRLVSGKACDLMKDYARLCKGKHVPDVKDKDALLDLLHSVHNEAVKEGSNAFTSACSQASLLIVRILAAQDRENLRQVVAAYASIQERLLFDPQCKVKISFLLDWLNWCAQARK